MCIPRICLELGSSHFFVVGDFLLTHHHVFQIHWVLMGRERRNENDRRLMRTSTTHLNGVDEWNSCMVNDRQNSFVKKGAVVAVVATEVQLLPTS